MARPIGSKAVLNGKPVVWSGDGYEWQSPGSYSKLKQSGHFNIGRKELDALTRYLGPLAQHVASFQQQVKKATPWLDPVEKVANKAVSADDRLPSSRVAQGGAIVAQRVGQAVNIDPRLTIGIPMLLGAVHTSGPRAGTTKLRAQPNLKVPHNQLEDLVEGGYQHVKQEGGLRGYRQTVQLPDGNEVYVYNRGNVDFNTRNGLTIKTRPSSGQPTPTVRVIPNNRSSPWANTPELNSRRQLLINQGLPDPNLRYQPKPTPEGRGLARDQKELLATAAPDTQTLKTHLKEFDTSTNAAVTVKGVTYTPKSDKIRVVPASDKKLNVTTSDGLTTQHIVKGSKTIQAEVRQLPGHEKTVIDSFQAHHRALLKESADFMSYFDDPSPIHAAYTSNKIYGGTQALNRTDLPVRLHQGDLTVKGDNGRVYRGYLNDAAHERLQAKPGTIEEGFPIQAEQGTSRWSFLADLKSDEERLQYVDHHINDLIRAQRIADESYFTQFLIKPADPKYGSDPYIGNFAQQVLAPHDKIAPILEQAYKTHRKGLLINGP
jgi:hypothetical protein